jgi:hypothetical protein
MKVVGNQWIVFIEPIRVRLLDDAGYHFGLVGENAVKYAVVTACGFLPGSLKQHFARPLLDAIARSQDVATVLMNGRLSVVLAQDIQNGSFNHRFAKWNIAIRYADSSHPVTTALVSSWRADALESDSNRLHEANPLISNHLHAPCTRLSYGETS